MIQGLLANCKLTRENVLMISEACLSVWKGGGGKKESLWCGG